MTSSSVTRSVFFVFLLQLCHPGTISAFTVSPPFSNLVRGTISFELFATPLRSRDESSFVAPSMIQKKEQSSFVPKDALLFGGFVAYCFVFSILWITWEDHACSHLWPNRHRTMLSLAEPVSWGTSTVHGLGFGAMDHKLLDAISDERQETYMPSYNEVMLQHRTNNVKQWKQLPSVSEKENAIHTTVQCLQKVWYLQEHSSEYEWESLRTELRAAPFSQLSTASSTLRKMGRTELRETVGFDWGSCAWRHCGALADVQESLDEIDSLLGVLEPFEVNFCLDIVERSLRDIIATIPFPVASETDQKFFSALPEYVSKLSDDANDDSYGQLDDDYLKVLRDLRVD